MMNKSKKEADFAVKQQEEGAKGSTTSSEWVRVNKDPRIVRVSRALGGKDRHSKVCTIRGLRDRRVRLSVPTAIHLYDLQDRLGLTQPSKVVDWLLNAAKHDIDELPPLPLPPPRFTLANNDDDVSNPIWKSSRSKHVSQETVNSAHVLPNTGLLPIRANHIPSFIGLLNSMPVGNYQWEPPPSSSADLGNCGIANYQTDHMHHSINVVPFPSALSLSAGATASAASSQILVCPPPPPPGAAHVAAAMENMDPRQINSQYHHQLLMSTSNNSHQYLSMINSVNPFGFAARATTATPKLVHSPNNSSENHSSERRGFPSK